VRNDAECAATLDFGLEAHNKKRPAKVTPVSN
jgi:hypothetical protein